MNRTLYTTLSLSFSLLATGLAGPVHAGGTPNVPTATIATLLMVQQTSDDDFNAGVDAQRNKQWAKAITAFSNAIKRGNKQDTWVAYYSRGDCYMAQNQFDKAIADYTQVIDIKPKLADAYRFRGRAYNYLQQPDKAITDFNKALELKGPGFFEVYGDRAQSYFIKNDYEKAIADYSIFIERIKRTRQQLPIVYYNRGRAYLNKYQADKEQGKEKEADAQAALADFEQYTSEASANNLDASNAYLARADAYLITKNYDKAVSNFNLYLAKNPKDDYALVRRGVAYEGLADAKNVSQTDQARYWDTALKDFQDALAINSTSTNAQAGVTRILLHRDPDTALAMLSKGIDNPPKKEQKDKVASRALVYMQKKDYANAIRDYEFLLKIDPQNQSALRNRATAYLNNNTFDKAIADYDSYLAIAPKDDEGVTVALTGKAAALISLKQYDQAAQVFTDIIAKNQAAKRDDPSVYLNRAKAYYNMKAYDKAIPDLDKYLAAKADDADAKKLRLDAELNSVKNPDEQVAVLTKAITSDPNNATLRLNLAAVYFKQGEQDPSKYDLAINTYNDAIKVSPNDATALYGRGAAYAKKKDWDNSIKDATAALAIKPDYTDAQMLRAQASLEAKKYPDAIRDYEAVYTKDKTNADALKGLAFAYVANKDYANTVRVMTDYIPQHPTDLDAVYSRGVAYVGLMKYTEGIADLTTYINGGGTEKSIALYNRGLANAKLGNNDAALADYEASLALKNDYNVALEAGKVYVLQADKLRDSDPPKAGALYGKASDDYAKALTALDSADAKDPELPKKKAEALRSQAVAVQNKGFLLEDVKVLKDALDLFNKYLAIAKPLNMPEVPDSEKTVDKINKYIKENS